ncbi:MAG TPA: 50S ribosomal protein L21 [Candidatus Paceibacterota bacterium]|jgi:large subunit ribosomal protein L21|nr:50S ribosomal protein L21 [Candidatus Paceibacterota bacterium]HRS47777.1 50S ribosomal protein L21 [Candidatus Paceibacterota bacterium]
MLEAVVKIKGHQFLVKEGDLLVVDNLNKKEGEKVNFEEVYLIFDSEKPEKVIIGKPLVKKSLVEAEIIKNFRGRKIITVKYGPKTRRKTKKGFKPSLTQIKITKIIGS